MTEYYSAFLLSIKSKEAIMLFLLLAVFLQFEIGRVV